MFKPPRNVSSSSAASSTKPTTLHRPSHSHRRALSQSSSWSAWIPGSISRKLTPKIHTPGTAGKERKSADYLKPSIKVDKGRKGSLRTPGSINRRKKSVTIEEPNDKADAEVASEAGTVRRGTTSEVSSSNFVGSGHAGAEVNESYDGNVHDTGVDIATSPGPENRRAMEGEYYRPGHPRRQIRTVSRDDYLTGRGANPRTGLISPSISSPSDTSMPHLHQTASALDKKWRLKGDQWVSLDTHDITPLPTPPTDEDAARPIFISPRDQAQAYIGQLSKSGVPLTTLEDRFVVNMPSAKEPCPPTMTPHQILDFQRAIERVYRHNEEMLDPETPPTPRAVTPEGRSTPPKKLLKRNPLSFLKKRNPGSAKQQTHPPGTPVPRAGNTQDAEKPDSRQGNLAHHESNTQNKGIETSGVPFLEDANATVGCQTTHIPQSLKGCLRHIFLDQSTPPEILYQKENHPQQVRLNAANAAGIVLKRPRSNSLQGRRLMKHIPANTDGGPVKLLSLDDGRGPLSSTITTTTTTSTNTTTTSGQKAIEQYVVTEKHDVPDYPTQQPLTKEYFQVLCPAASVESLGDAAIELETVRGAVNENISQMITRQEGMIPHGRKEAIGLNGYTLTLETQSSDMKGIEFDSRLYPDLLAPCLWFLVFMLECVLTLAICCLNGAIWLCTRTREHWLEYVYTPGK